MRGLLQPGHLITNRTDSEMLLGFTTHLITLFHAHIKKFPAFLAIPRREEAVIMQ